MALFLLGTFFVAWSLAGYVVELIFGGLGLIPEPATAKIPDQGVSWNYTTWLNIVFLTLAAALLFRFFRTGGLRDAADDGRRARAPAPRARGACASRHARHGRRQPGRLRPPDQPRAERHLTHYQP